jgi:penicillin-binding protein 1A
MVIALVATACAIQPIEDPGIGAGSLTSTVYAADGTVLTEWHADQDRVLVSYDDLPGHLVDAVVAVEDHRFWVHSGIDPRAVVRAAGANIRAGEIVEGGSTITQQYVKNVLLNGDVTIERKLAEAGLALQLEETLTKPEILERYLNTISFGRGTFGVATAARRYFGKAVGELTLADSALLAGMVNAPSDLDPYLYPEAAIGRRRVVLERMADLEWITPEDARRAAAAPLRLRDAAAVEEPPAAYFVAEVRRRLLQAEALGADEEERRRLLDEGGLRIFTTLDPDLQRAAEAAVEAVLPGDGPSAALAALDPATGEVLALVGGRDFFDPDDPVAQFNLATQGLRQPGSAFKPFTLAAALEAGLHLDDVFPGGHSVTLTTADGEWTVENHEGAVYPALTLREATVFSVNTVFARVVEAIGPERVAGLAEAAGITTPLDPVPSITLGSQEVTVLDLASAYGTFAAGGVHAEPVFVTRIEAPDGSVVFRDDRQTDRVVSGATAGAVTAALTETVRRGTGRHARIGRPVAGKTGTTEGNHDAWFAGYTPEITAAVWVGFPEGNRALEAPNTPYTVTGGTWPAQIWARFAAAALAGIPYDEPPDAGPDGLVAVEIDLTTGFLAGPLCPRSHVATVRVKPGAAPTVPCPVHGSGIPPAADGTVPGVGGLPLEDAVMLLEDAGFFVEAVWTDPGALPPGTVAAAAPEPGTAAGPGTVVRLTVAGPEPGTVAPDVLGLPEAEARERLAGLGHAALVLRLPESDPDDAAGRPGTVWAQRPPAGTPVAERVTLWVNP